MTDLVQFAVVGIAAGGLYALAALGLVVIYRGSGTVNFAHGSVAAVGAYVYWCATRNGSMPLIAGLALGAAASGLLGVCTYWLVMRPMARLSSIQRTVATLGVSVVVETVLVMRVPNQTVLVRSLLPRGVTRFGSLAISHDRLGILLLAMAAAAVLSVISRRTRIGLATAAVAENQQAAAALGISPDRVATLTWALGSAVAGVAGILLVPILGLRVTVLSAMLVPALAAAVTGGMTSFGLTLVGGIVIGVVQSELTRYVDTPGWGAAVPFFLLLGVMVLRGRAIPVRGEHAERLPSVGSGALRAQTIVVGVAVALFLIWGPFGVAFVDATSVSLAVTIIMLSVVVITGFAGQLSLCQYGFAGLGAFVAGRLVGAWGWPVELAVPIAVTVAALSGVVVGLPALRTRGINLAIITLGFAVALQELIFANPSVNGGLAPDDIGPLHLFGVDVDAIANPRRYATVITVALVLTALVVANVRRGVSGRRLLAIRESERASASVGIDSLRPKLFGFALSAAIASVGGVLSSFRNPVQLYDSSFTPFESIRGLGYVVLGGVGHIGGALVAAQFAPATLSAQVLHFIEDGDNVHWLQLAGGVLLLVTLLANPNGAAPELGVQFRVVVGSLRRAVHLGSGRDLAGRSMRPAGATPTFVVPEVRLEVRGLSVRFGGVLALDEVDLDVAGGEVLGVIGPNGAGKSTLVDAITGFVAVVSGVIRLDGVDIGHLSAARRARTGVTRSFQQLELFQGLTVLENILTACDSKRSSVYLTDLVRPDAGSLSPAAIAAIDHFQLWDDLRKRPEELPFGRRRLVAIARAVATAPPILLLDEPAAGLGEGEAQELGQLVRSLVERHGMGVLLIEHNVDLVLSISDRVLLLDFGRKLVEGSPNEVRAHPELTRAYLGEGDCPPEPSLNGTSVG